MATTNYKIDLHTHSVASPDGSITPEQYFKVLDQGKLDAIAVTDHNDISMASKLASVRPEQIIIGEEIMTSDGELIGLFLSELVRPGASAKQTAERIKKQGGVVIVPHPSERWRSALSIEVMEQIKNEIDAVELYNGRSLKVNNSVKEWCIANQKAIIAASDTHSKHDLGTTFTAMQAVPTAQTFKRYTANAQPVIKRASLRGRLAPKINLIKRPKSD